MYCLAVPVVTSLRVEPVTMRSTVVVEGISWLAAWGMTDYTEESLVQNLEVDVTQLIRARGLILSELVGDAPVSLLLCSLKMAIQIP